MLNISELRKTIKQKRLDLSDAFREDASRLISSQIVTQPFYKSAQHIATYRAVQGEANPIYVSQQAWLQNKHCYLPTLTEQILTFKHFQENSEFIINKYNVEEPVTSAPAIPIVQLDCIFVPLVAFDHFGNRLGMGKGYYDKTLSLLKNKPQQEKPILVGIAYELQRVEELPVQPWDIPLDYVVTETSLFQFKRE